MCREWEFCFSRYYSARLTQGFGTKVCQLYGYLFDCATLTDQCCAHSNSKYEWGHCWSWAVEATTFSAHHWRLLASEDERMGNIGYFWEVMALYSFKFESMIRQLPWEKWAWCWCCTYSRWIEPLLKCRDKGSAVVFAFHASPSDLLTFNSWPSCC